jgi:uncharacterized protein YjbI with pentapeptide repeats
MMERFEECPFCGEPIRPRVRMCRSCGALLGRPTRSSVLGDQGDGAEALTDGLDGFSRAYIRGAELRGAYMTGMDLFGADLVGADLRGADLGWANLSNADLQGADLTGANLTGADLSDAKLNGADLRGANLMDSDLEGAIYDGLTCWPEDFDPQVAGAVGGNGVAG